MHTLAETAPDLDRHLDAKPSERGQDVYLLDSCYGVRRTRGVGGRHVSALADDDHATLAELDAFVDPEEWLS